MIPSRETIRLRPVGCTFSKNKHLICLPFFSLLSFFKRSIYHICKETFDTYLIRLKDKWYGSNYKKIIVIKAISPTLNCHTNTLKKKCKDVLVSWSHNQLTDIYSFYEISLKSSRLNAELSMAAHGANVARFSCCMHASDYRWQSAFRIVKAIMYSVDGRIKDTLLLGA